MELTIKLCRQDFELYSQFLAQGGSSNYKKANLWLNVMIFTIAMLSAILFLTFVGDIDWPSVFMTIFMLGVAFTPQIYRGKVIADLYLPKDGSNDFYARDYTINEKGIGYRVGDTSCWYEWGAISRIEVSADAIYVLVGMTSSLMFPKNRVVEHEQFLVRLNEYHQKAQATLKI